MPNLAATRNVLLSPVHTLPLEAPPRSGTPSIIPLSTIRGGAAGTGGASESKPGPTPTPT